MIVSDLYSQTAQLGFEQSLEDDARFIYAANRAILQVCKLKPAICRYVLNHRPLENALQDDTFAPITRTDDLIFEARGVKSFYAEADGNGVLYVEKYDEAGAKWDIVNSVELRSQGAFIAYKGFVRDGEHFVADCAVRLRFSGEYLYSVKNVALYADLLSGDESDIPAFEPYSRYDIRKLAPDFFALCSSPLRESESSRITEYETEGDSVIILPRDKKGVYKILYEHRPNEIVDNGDVSNDETEIDLDVELCSLLPVLIAGYVWADDEPEKSEYYMALYRERADEVKKSAASKSPVQFINKKGW